MILAVLEAFTAFLIFFTTITQIIIPLWNDRPIFPMFNKRKETLEKHLTSLNELEDEQQLTAKIQERVSSLNNTKDNTND